jgi:hypothetical protein
MNRNTWITALVIALIIIGVFMFWGGNKTDDNGQLAVPAESEVAATVAQNALAIEANRDVSEIEIVSAELREWPNSCLGLAGEDEMCAEVITPGWEITLEVDGETYVYRSDLGGNSVRADN